MATGAATSWKLEVQWDGTNWVDESTYLRAGQDYEVTITRGRANEADDMQPGVLSGTLDNLDGRFTPDNPLSALYPNVQDGVRTRFSITKGGSSWWRHNGRLVLGEPVLEDGDTARSIVHFQSVGPLGALANRTMRCDFVERWLNTAETQQVDLFPFEGTTLTNLGSSTGAAAIVPDKTGAGTWAVGSPDGVMLDSQVSLSVAGASRSPVIKATVGSSITSTGMVVINFRTAARAPSSPAGSTRIVAQGFDSANAQVWAVRLRDNGAGVTDLMLYDSSNTAITTLYSGWAGSGDDQGDDQWFALSLENGGSQGVFLRRVVDNTLIASFGGVGIDSRNTRTVYLGGQADMTFGALVFSSVSSGSATDYLTQSRTEGADDRYSDMNLYADFASSTTGSANPLVSLKQLSGRSAFDVLAEIGRTVGSVAVEDMGTYSLTFLMPDVLRTTTVKATLGVTTDLTTEFPWRKGDVPSSVTATWPGGQVTYTDTTRVRVDESVDTCAASQTTALSVAAARVRTSRRLRLTRLVIDLASSANDLWASVMALEIGDRLRVTLGSAGDTLVTQFGYTYVDVYVAGWNEVYAQDYAVLEIDTIPADDPVNGQFGSGLRSKFKATPGSMTVTGGTAVGTTSTGTVIVTTTAGNPPLTQTASAYPMTFDWNGEFVTVTSAPASATSPQTLTITARGVAPTVARSHATGEKFDVALGSAFSF